MGRSLDWVAISPVSPALGPTFSNCRSANQTVAARLTVFLFYIERRRPRTHRSGTKGTLGETEAGCEKIRLNAGRFAFGPLRFHNLSDYSFPVLAMSETAVGPVICITASASPNQQNTGKGEGAEGDTHVGGIPHAHGTMVTWCGKRGINCTICST